MNNMRKNTPDILGNLMGIEQENNNTISLDTNSIHKNMVNVYGKTIKQGREKTTFNLSENIIHQLDDAWMKLRRKFKGEKKITKTLIVESALEILFRDFDAKNEMSELYTYFKK